MIPRLSRPLAAAAILLALVSTAVAQGPPGRGQRGGGPGGGGPGGFPGGGPGGGPGGFFGGGLVSIPAVQKELALTEKQKTQIKKVESTMAQKRRSAFGRGRGGNERPDIDAMRKSMESLQSEQKKSIAAVLEPKQRTRLLEIELQQEGLMAVARPDVASKLKLTSAQTQQVEKIVADMREEERNAMPRFGGRGRRGPQDAADGDRPQGDEPGDDRGFPGGGRRPRGEGGFPGGPPQEGDEGGFPGGGPPPGGEGGFPGDVPPPGGGDDDGPGGPDGPGRGPGRGFGGRPGFNPEEFRAQFEKMRQERERIHSTATTAINEVLTTQQRSEFKKLQGKSFNLASLRPGPGQGPGGQNRAGARQNNNRTRGQTRTRTPREAPPAENEESEPQF